MELELTRETIRFEQLAARSAEQVTIEGDAMLPGSMRDAVTVLAVLARAHLTGVTPGNGEATLRGRVNFRLLYSQGDLTRIRSLETSCSFEHRAVIAGATPQSRIQTAVCVQETEGIAGSGRVTLRALLGIEAEAFETVQRDWITGISGGGEAGVQTLEQTVCSSISEVLGEGSALVREEFDLPAKAEAGEVLSVTAEAGEPEISGGGADAQGKAARTGVSGVIMVRVLHRSADQGRPPVTTTHELPYDAVIEAQLPEGAQLTARAEVTDVMADAVPAGDGMTLRVEAEVRVVLSACMQQEKTLLADAYTLCGEALEIETQETDALTCEAYMQAMESTRIQVQLPEDAPPVGTMLAAFAQPVLAGVAPAGRRLEAEGVMNLTLVYLPLDSDVPYAVKAKEPFSMTFPVEAGEGVTAELHAVETTPGAATSDRAEVRCVLMIRAVRRGVRRIRGVKAVTAHPAQKEEHGFVLVWPPEGESRWETARRLRVAQESLRSVGKGALLAMRR